MDQAFAGPQSKMDLRGARTKHKQVSTPPFRLATDKPLPSQEALKVLGIASAQRVPGRDADAQAKGNCNQANTIKPVFGRSAMQSKRHTKKPAGVCNRVISHSAPTDHFREDEVRP